MEEPDQFIRGKSAAENAKPRQNCDETGGWKTQAK
jgi:predicted small metal-binding protein